jgi:hypothetical protein
LKIPRLTLIIAVSKTISCNPQARELVIIDTIPMGHERLFIASVLSCLSFGARILPKINRVDSKVRIDCSHVSLKPYFIDSRKLYL